MGFKTCITNIMQEIKLRKFGKNFKKVVDKYFLL